MQLKSPLATLLLVFLLFNAGVSISQQNNRNQTIQRFIVTNDQNEILMEHNEQGWMTPALAANSNLGVTEALDSLANTFGLKIAPPSLKGLYTVEFTQNEETSFESHYKVKHLSGEISIPKDKLNAKWVSKDEAKRLMNLPSFKAISTIRATTVLILEELDSY